MCCEEVDANVAITMESEIGRRKMMQMIGRVCEWALLGFGGVDVVVVVDSVILSMKMMMVRGVRCSAKRDYCIDSFDAVEVASEGRGRGWVVVVAVVDGENDGDDDVDCSGRARKEVPRTIPSKTQNSAFEAVVVLHNHLV